MKVNVVSPVVSEKVPPEFTVMLSPKVVLPVKFKVPPEMVVVQPTVVAAKLFVPLPEIARF